MAPPSGKPQVGGDTPESGTAPVLAPGLYFVATPIGHARDITLRALDILRDAEVIAAEDTRTARKLMEIHGIPVAGRPMLPYHDHNGAEMRPKILARLRKGASVAYVSEAGTPLVADPGFQLARAAIDAGIPVTGAPGASAALAALTVSGLPSDRFLFAGFPPAQAGARAKWIAGLDAAAATVILYESPRRVHRLLTELCDALGDDRPAALARELTKKFEEVLRGTLGSLRDDLEDRTPKGEVVLLIGRAEAGVAEPMQVEAALRDALGRMRVKDAAAEVAAELGLPRREVYQMALRLKEDEE